MSIQKREELRVLAKAVTPQDFDSTEIDRNMAIDETVSKLVLEQGE